MKKRRILAAAVALAVAISMAGCRKAPGLSVNVIRQDPSVLAGTVTVTGVVGAFSPTEPNLFGLMDVAELQCKAENCNKFFLPVRQAGAMPKLGDELSVTGALTDVPGGKIFVAEKIRVLRNHKL